MGIELHKLLKKPKYFSYIIFFNEKETSNVHLNQNTNINVDQNMNLDENIDSAMLNYNLFLNQNRIQYNYANFNQKIVETLSSSSEIFNSINESFDDTEIKTIIKKQKNTIVNSRITIEKISNHLKIKLKENQELIKANSELKTENNLLKSKFNQLYKVLIEKSEQNEIEEKHFYGTVLEK